MARNSEYQGWVTETCKKCGKAFMYNDTKGVINDEPTKKFYCPECQKNGFKNTKKGKLTPEEYLKINNITDKELIKEFKRQLKYFIGKNLNYDNVMKNTVKILEYNRKK